MPPEFGTELLDLERRNLYAALGALGLFLLMVVGHRFLFGGWRPKTEVGIEIRERLRWVSLPLLLLVPLWWVATQLPELFFLSAEIFVTSALLAIVVLLEPVRIGLKKLSSLPDSVLFVALYALPVVVYLVSLFQLPLLEGPNAYAVGTVLVFFVFLQLIYTYLFRWVQWKHPLALVLRTRLRGWVYVGVLTSTLYFALLRFPGLVSSPFWLAVLAGSLMLLALLVISEAVLAGVFDFYFPVAKRAEIPTFFRDLVRGLVYLGAFLAFVGIVLKRDLDSLLVGSAVITVSIGFALQETLGNFFAGLALRLSRPYSLGDNVEIGAITGRVDKIDWRQTCIYTFTGDHIILPNSMLAKEAIKNHSSPTPLHARDVRVGLHYRHPPNVVIDTIRSVLDGVDTVRKQPNPEIHLLDFEDSAILYRIKYWIDNYSDRFNIDSRVRIGLWYAFNRDNLEIPFPIRTLVQAPEGDPVQSTEIQTFLSTVDFLEALGSEALESLAQRARFQLFSAGEKICRQGESGDTFYVIRSGRVGVEIKDASGKVFLSSEMAVGNYFGEMALLTGEPRSATVYAITDADLLTVSKEDLRDLIVSNPDVEKIISTVLAQRQLRTEKAREEAAEERAHRGKGSDRSGGHRLEQLSEQLLKKIQAFFSY